MKKNLRKKIVLAILLVSSAAGFPCRVAARPPGGATVTVDTIQYTNAPVAIDILIRSVYWPPSRVYSAQRTTDRIVVELLNPETYEVVPSYEYSLHAEVPPTGDSSVAEVEIYAIDYPGDPLPELVRVGDDPVEFSPGVRILEVIPPRPSVDDEIVLRFSAKPAESPQLVSGLQMARIYMSGAAVAGINQWDLPIGRLPAGRNRIEVFGSLGETQKEVEVVPADPGGGGNSPAILAEDFEVNVAWQNHQGETGEAKLVQPPSRDSALYYFFTPENWELMVKVLDGCALNGHYWVFGAASTDVGYNIRIDRRGSSQSFRAENPVGNIAPAITDIKAFPCDPAQVSGGPFG